MVSNTLITTNKAKGEFPEPVPLGAAGSEPDITPTTGELKRSFISRGEKVHKWSTYLGVDWIFNAIAGVSFAYWGKYTETGKKYWSGPLTRGWTAALKPFIKHPESLNASVNKGNMFISIIMGGMFTIPPLMVLENSKVRLRITQWWDNLIYGKEKVENDPKFQQAYQEILDEPKKDFTSGMCSRFLALAPLLAMVLATPTRKLSDKLYFDHVERASDKAARAAGFSPEKQFKNLPPKEAAERWKFIHANVAMDFGLGIPYAVLHAFFYNKVAKHFDKRKDCKKEDQPSTIAAPPEPVVVPAPESDAAPVNWVKKSQAAAPSGMAARLDNKASELTTR